MYLSNRSGIRFEALTQFAEPLFDVYDIDWHEDEGYDARSRNGGEWATIVAVLDTARLIWAYFSLGKEKRDSMLPHFENILLGMDAGEEEHQNLLLLLTIMEKRWLSISPEDRARAMDTPGYVLPTFEALLAHFVGIRDPFPSFSTLSLGVEESNLPEVLARFAEPLLQDPVISRDPEQIEERIERAQAYWELATAPPSEFDERLQQIEKAFALSEDDRVAIREEAQWMVSRFKGLFLHPSEGDVEDKSDA